MNKVKVVPSSDTQTLENNYHRYGFSTQGVYVIVVNGRVRLGNGCVCGGNDDRGGYNTYQNPYLMARGYGKFRPEDKNFSSQYVESLTPQQNNKLQDIKVTEGWYNCYTPPHVLAPKTLWVCTPPQQPHRHCW